MLSNSAGQIEAVFSKKQKESAANDTKDGFKVVRRRRQRGVGSGDGKDTFQGRPEKQKKLWLFITRVPDSVEEEDVRKYVAEKTGSEDVSVKQLETILSKKDNRSFMIGMSVQQKDSVYKAEFWPKGIHFERFDFRRGQKFLDNRQDENIKSRSQIFPDLQPMTGHT